MFKNLLAKLFTAYVRGLVKQGLAMAQFYLATMPADQVTQAKTTLKAAIQTLHKVPGELRKYACWEVDQVDATDVGDLLAKLQALVA